LGVAIDPAETALQGSGCAGTGQRLGVWLKTGNKRRPAGERTATH